MGKAKWVALMAVGFAGASCSDFGASGTGERVVSKERLRTAERDDLSRYATTKPTAPRVTDPLPTSLPTTREVWAGAEEVRLTLEDARMTALENNLDLRVEKLSPTISLEGLNAERAKFEAVFTTDLRYSHFDQPTASRLNSAQSEQTTVSPGVRVPLYLGGSVAASVPVTGNSNDNSFSTLNPSYNANPALTYEQPLLRGFGVASNAASIRVAFYANQQAEVRTKLQVLTVLANVDRLYWRLYAAQQEYAVRRAEYEVNSMLLQRNRRRLAAKLDPEVEVTRAESALADTLESVQNAENTVRLRERELKRVMNKPGLEMNSATRIIIASGPQTLYAKLNREAMAAVAITNRMELLEQELAILSNTASIDAARNGLLPTANLTYTYRVNGLGQSFEEAFAQAGNNRYSDNQIGLSIEIPIGNEAARARLRQALATRMQTLATKAQRTAQITQELFDALDSLELARQNIIAAQRRVMLNQRLLDAETRLLDAGQRTSTDVLDVQSKLASARSAEVLATTNFQIAQVDIAFATGTLLGSGSIVWQPVPPEKVGRYIP